MKISACSIVKNEALNIGRSIESYKDAVDEIIIVDTGSTDNTVEICKAHGAKVIFFKWCDDFSAAKNYALEHTKGDWIIFLDADEWFVPKLKRSYLLNTIKQVKPSMNGIITTMCDIEPDTGKIRLRGLTNRIFRGSKKIRYHGSIHEKLLNAGGKLIFDRKMEIEIFHSGYANGLVKIKSKRNIDILYSAYNKGEISTELYFYIFRENCYLGDVDEAAKFYELFMKQEDADEIIKSKDAIVCIFEIMYSAMLKRPDRFSQQDINAILETAYTKYPKLPIHSYLIGTEKLKVGEYLESYSWLTKAIELNKIYSEPYTNVFVGYLADAYFKLGYIRQKQDRKEDALTQYMEAAKRATSIELPLLLPRLISIIEAQPQEEIILFLNSMIDISKKENVEVILDALKQTRLHKVFIYYAVRYNQEFDGQNETTYIAMILSGQAELAIETAIESSRNYIHESALELRAERSNIKGVSMDFTKEDYATFPHEILYTADNKDETEAYHGNWHLDYAIVGILYSNSFELYQKYKLCFNQEQNEIIEAYLGDNRIYNATEKLRLEHAKIYKNLFFIFEDLNLNNLKNIII